MQIDNGDIQLTFAENDELHQVGTVVLLLPLNQSTSDVFSSRQRFLPKSRLVSRSEPPVGMFAPVGIESGVRTADPSKNLSSSVTVQRK